MNLLSLFFLKLLLLLLVNGGRRVQSQQPYLNNDQLDCYTNHSNTLGYACNSTPTKCSSYLLFRSYTPYNTPLIISYLFDADDTLTGNSSLLPDGTPVLVRIPCSCSAAHYQHNATYSLKQNETYFDLANNTFEALTTCQALIAQNPSVADRNMLPGMKITVPLLCACPTENQTAAGIKYLMTYPVAKGEDVSSLAGRFGVNEESINYANGLSDGQTIYFFTPLLIPLTKEPTLEQILGTTTTAPPPPPVSLSSPPGSSSGRTNRLTVVVGAVIGAVCLCSGVVIFVIYYQKKRKREDQTITANFVEKKQQQKQFEQTSSSSSGVFLSTNFSGKKKTTFSNLSEGLLSAVRSLPVYKFEELQVATGNFSEESRIKRSSVYKGVINGDAAAVKRMKGDVVNEINILKQINHSNIIRLSGFCFHGGNTYLVYEFAENGSVSDWIHRDNNQFDQSCLNWTERIQIAIDVADGLHYLHNYAKPGYIHKDLKSSNILLDDNLRAKITNFASARPTGDQEEGIKLTKHVVGTQGYMAPEYLEHGLITPKLDVFSFGVVLLELISGREAIYHDDQGAAGGGVSYISLWAVIGPILDFDCGGSGEEENYVEMKLREFMDPLLKNEYPIEKALLIAKLARSCVDTDLNSRPSMADVLLSLSKIVSPSSMDWEPPSDPNSQSVSIVFGR